LADYIILKQPRWLHLLLLHFPQDLSRFACLLLVLLLLLLLLSAFHRVVLSCARFRELALPQLVTND
jgi:hypothetical protein